MITVIGLGNGPEDLTRAGEKALREAQKQGQTVVLKTEKCASAKAVKGLKIAYKSLDFLYEKAGDFDELNGQIVGFLLGIAGAEDGKSGSEGNVLYCVDGAGYDDASVKMLNLKVPVDIIAGVAKSARVLHVRPYESVTVMTVAKLLRANELPHNIPLVVYELDDKLTAQSVKLKLLEYFDPETLVVTETDAFKLFELDRLKKYDYSTAFMVCPRRLTERKLHGFGDVVAVMKKLRAPDGCPWDRAQTHASIRGNVIEEACELVEAIELNDPEKTVEEAGDVLLQSVFHSVMAEEAGEFTVTDMLSGLVNKLISRHTHIFGADKASNPEESLKFWDEAKKKEKGFTDTKSKLLAVPNTFGSLMKASKVQKILKKAGAKLPTDGRAGEVKNEKEAGELLFSVVNSIRERDIDPEVALLGVTNKYINDN